MAPAELMPMLSPALQTKLLVVTESTGEQVVASKTHWPICEPLSVIVMSPPLIMASGMSAE